MYISPIFIGYAVLYLIQKAVLAQMFSVLNHDEGFLTLRELSRLFCRLAEDETLRMLISETQTLFFA